MNNPLNQITLEGRSDAPLQPGLRLFHQRYELVKLLGAGGMGVVWQAKDHHLDEKVFALKFLPGVRAWSDGDLVRLRKEVLASQDLRDVHLAATHGFEHQPPYAAMVMEHVDGRTLKQALEESGRGCFSPEEVRSWMLSLVAALKYLHGTAGRIHRDLKPANVMITRQGRLKLLDFGISENVRHTLSQHASTPLAYGSSHTLSSASPQQLRGDPPAESDDIYSLGALLYELLSGRPPFYRGNADAVAYQIRNEPPVNLDKRRKELLREGVLHGDLPPVPASWQQLVFDCLAKEPEARPTLDELDDFLKQPVRSAPPPVSAPSSSAVLSAIKKEAEGKQAATPSKPETAAAVVHEERESEPVGSAGYFAPFVKLFVAVTLLALGAIAYFWFSPETAGQKPQPVRTTNFTTKNAEDVVHQYYAAAEDSQWQGKRLTLWAPQVKYFDEGTLKPAEVMAIESRQREASGAESYTLTSVQGSPLGGGRFRVNVVFQFHMLRKGQSEPIETSHRGEIELGTYDQRLLIESIQARRMVLYPAMEKAAVKSFLDQLVALGEWPPRPGALPIDVEMVKQFYSEHLDRYYKEADPSHITPEFILQEEQRANSNNRSRHYEWDGNSPQELVSGAYGTPQVTVRRTLLVMVEPLTGKPIKKLVVQATSLVLENGAPKVKGVWLE